MNLVSRTVPGEDGTTELSLDEELAIHEIGGGVEGCAWDGRVNVVLGTGRVGNQEPDGLKLVEATGVVEAGEDRVDICKSC